MQFPLLLELHRSRRLDFLLVAFHLAAALSLLVALWPRDDLIYRYPLLALLLALVGLSAWRALRRKDIDRLKLDAEGVLFVARGGGKSQRAAVLSDSTVFRHLAVLRLRIEGEARVRNVALLPDQMSAEQFRQLNLCLRWLVKTDMETEA